MPEGIDYAFGRPTIAALRAAGVRFVCRYLSHSASKNLTAAEARQLSDAGIWIVVVWETTAQRALGGRTAGVADALDAQTQAQACGMPRDRPVYFAVDWDASSGQQAAINAYLDGAASVLGRGRVGIYGGYGPVQRAMDGGHAAWGWQTYAWSAGRWHGPAHLQQYSNDHTIGGVGCDYNRATAADYGQWRVGATPAPQPQEEDDMIAGKLETTGQTVISFPTGKYGAIGFSCDNGFVQAPAAKLRVAAHRTDGSWQVVPHVTVGRATPTDPAKKAVVTFTDKAHTDYVVVTREDETNPLAIGFDAS